MSPVSQRLHVVDNRSNDLLSVTRKYPFSIRSEVLNEETESNSCNVSTDETRHNRVSAPVITSAGNLKQPILDTLVRLETESKAIASERHKFGLEQKSSQGGISGLFLLN